MQHAAESSDIHELREVGGDQAIFSLFLDANEVDAAQQHQRQLHQQMQQQQQAAAAAAAAAAATSTISNHPQLRQQLSFGSQRPGGQTTTISDVVVVQAHTVTEGIAPAVSSHLQRKTTNLNVMSTQRHRTGASRGSNNNAAHMMLPSMPSVPHPSNDPADQQHHHHPQQMQLLQATTGTGTGQLLTASHYLRQQQQQLRALAMADEDAEDAMRFLSAGLPNPTTAAVASHSGGGGAAQPNVAATSSSGGAGGSKSSGGGVAEHYEPQAQQQQQQTATSASEGGGGAAAHANSATVDRAAPGGRTVLENDWVMEQLFRRQHHYHHHDAAAAAASQRGGATRSSQASPNAAQLAQDVYEGLLRQHLQSQAKLRQGLSDLREQGFLEQLDLPLLLNDEDDEVVSDEDGDDYNGGADVRFRPATTATQQQDGGGGVVAHPTTSSSSNGPPSSPGPNGTSVAPSSSGGGGGLRQLFQCCVGDPEPSNETVGGRQEGHRSERRPTRTEVDWEMPGTYQRSRLTQRYHNPLVEKEYLRYDLRHHRVNSLVVFLVVLLVVSGIAAIVTTVMANVHEVGRALLPAYLIWWAMSLLSVVLLAWLFYGVLDPHRQSWHRRATAEASAKWMASYAAQQTYVPTVFRPSLSRQTSSLQAVPSTASTEAGGGDDVILSRMAQQQQQQQGGGVGTPAYNPNPQVPGTGRNHSPATTTTTTIHVTNGGIATGNQNPAHLPPSASAEGAQSSFPLQVPLPSFFQFMMHSNIPFSRKDARIVERIAGATCVLCLGGMLAVHTVMSFGCTHPEVFYVPWSFQGCPLSFSSNQTTGLADASDSKLCAEMVQYCSEALFPFWIPALSVPILLFRPRVVIAVPILLIGAPVAFVAGRYFHASSAAWGSLDWQQSGGGGSWPPSWMANDNGFTKGYGIPHTDHLESPSLFGLKFLLVFLLACLVSGIKVALEREQRLRFRAYGFLYCRLLQLVRRRETLASFFDLRISSRLRTRMLSGETILDYTERATVVALDIADFPTWCHSLMLPTTAAITAGQLHDVMTSRCAAMGVDKLRVVGDLFVATSGLLSRNPHHAPLCCQLALQVFSDVYEFRKSFAAPVLLRCCVHTGRLVGIVMGETHRRYEVFGEAMEVVTLGLDCCRPHQVLASLDTALQSSHFVAFAQQAPSSSSSSPNRHGRSSTPSIPVVPEVGAPPVVLLDLAKGPLDLTPPKPFFAISHLKCLVPVAPAPSLSHSRNLRREGSVSSNMSGSGAAPSMATFRKGLQRRDDDDAVAMREELAEDAQDHEEPRNVTTSVPDLPRPQLPPPRSSSLQPIHATFTVHYVQSAITHHDNGGRASNVRRGSHDGPRELLLKPCQFYSPEQHQQFPYGRVNSVGSGGGGGDALTGSTRSPSNQLANAQQNPTSPGSVALTPTSSSGVFGRTNNSLPSPQSGNNHHNGTAAAELLMDVIVVDNRSVAMIDAAVAETRMTKHVCCVPSGDSGRRRRANSHVEPHLQSTLRAQRRARLYHQGAYWQPSSLCCCCCCGGDDEYDENHHAEAGGEEEGRFSVDRGAHHHRQSFCCDDGCGARMVRRLLAPLRWSVRTLNKLFQLKLFQSEIHELEFTFIFLKESDRVPNLVAHLGSLLFLIAVIAIFVIERQVLGRDPIQPPTDSGSSFLPVFLKPSLRTAGDQQTVGLVLLAISATLTALSMIAVWRRQPAWFLYNSVLQWIFVCAVNALALFGAAAASPSMIGSDISYLFYLSLLTLHFGSWSVAGHLLISLVTLGVFLGAVHALEGTYLNVWSLPLLALSVPLNFYLDRTREYRQREQYRDLYLAKAAVLAVQHEETTRQNILRSMIPRPLLPLILSEKNAGRLLTNTIGDAVVLALRFDSLADDLMKLMVPAAEKRLKEMGLEKEEEEEGVDVVGPQGVQQDPARNHNRHLPNGSAGNSLPQPSSVAQGQATQMPGVPRRDSGTTGTSASTLLTTPNPNHLPSSPPSSHHPAFEDALHRTQRMPSVVEKMLDTLVGTELAIVHIHGDMITIAGPLEEEPAEKPTASNPVAAAPPIIVPQEELAADHRDDEDVRKRRRRQRLELRIQRAVYDATLLISMIHKYQRQLRLKEHTRTPTASPATQALFPPTTTTVTSATTQGSAAAMLSTSSTSMGPTGGGAAAALSPFLFSAACVCESIISVVSNAEVPTYDLLGTAAYTARALLAQTPRGCCVATEKFVQYFEAEMHLVEMEEVKQQQQSNSPLSAGGGSPLQQPTTTTTAAAAAMDDDEAVGKRRRRTDDDKKNTEDDDEDDEDPLARPMSLPAAAVATPNAAPPPPPPPPATSATSEAAAAFTQPPPLPPPISSHNPAATVTSSSQRAASPSDRTGGGGGGGAVKDSVRSRVAVGGGIDTQLLEAVDANPDLVLPPRIAPQERWRVRGLGVLWVHNIFPGWTSAPPAAAI